MRAVMILARWLACKAIKADWKVMGRKAEARESLARKPKGSGSAIGGIWTERAD